MILSQHGIIQSINRASAAPLLLDDYPGASAAYSLRKLKSGYTGSAVRVRRSNDNTEQDIGFSAGIIDETALTNFVGANSGFITTWYDQTGNGKDAVQTTASQQPRIVNSGTVEKDGDGLINIYFDGTTDRLRNTVSLAGGNNLSAFWCYRPIGGNDAFGYHASIGIYRTVAVDYGALHYVKQNNTGASYPFYDTFGAYDGSGSYSSIKYVMSFIFPNGAWNVYKNSSSEGGSNTFTTINANHAGFDISYQNAGGLERFTESRFYEVIFYATNESSNRLDIEGNINDYYLAF
jgi:hypothetical protein